MDNSIENSTVEELVKTHNEAIDWMRKSIALQNDMLAISSDEDTIEYMNHGIAVAEYILNILLYFDANDEQNSK